MKKNIKKIANSIFNERLKQLDEMVNVQCSDGNWNFDPYMHGMANGMIYSLNLMKDDFDNSYTGQKTSKPFLDAPEKWLSKKEED